MTRLGPYEVLGELGRGGMGVVYRARHTTLGHTVALKVLRTAPGPDGTPGTPPEALARFRREAQAAGRLADHPGIVAVRDAGEEAGTAWFAMDLIEGRGLDVLAAEGELSPAAAAGYVEAAARAVHVAHEAGILHRDLKPANVMVGRRAAGGVQSSESRVESRTPAPVPPSPLSTLNAQPSTAFVTDFGLATVAPAGGELTRLTRSGEILGTPNYMPPEQADGRPLDARADVYALGATLYEALTGSPPFGADSTFAVLVKVMREPPERPRLRDPAIPAALEAITLRCLEKQAARRYPSALALAEDLARFRTGGAVEARLPGWAARLARRRGARLAAAALGVLALAVGGGLALDAWRAARARGGREAAAREADATARAALAQLDERAAVALRAAIELRRSGNLAGMIRFAEAVEAACDEAARRVPDAAAPHYQRARMHRVMFRHREAMDALDLAVRHDPDHAGARTERACLLAFLLDSRVGTLQDEAQRAGVTGRLAGQPERPLADPLHLIAGDPVAHALAERLEADVARLFASPGAMDGPTRAALEGLRAAALGDAGGARAGLAAAVAGKVEMPEAVSLLASLVGAAGDFAGAMRVWDEGLARDAGYWPYREGRAEAWRARGYELHHAGEDPRPAYAAALADLDAWVALCPEHARAWRLRGMTRSWMSRAAAVRDLDPADWNAGALADLTEATRLEPGNAEAWCERAGILVNAALDERVRGQSPEAGLGAALRDFDEALRLDPDSGSTHGECAIAWLNLGFARERAGRDPDDALAQGLRHHDDAVRLDPANANRWRERGQARLILGDRRHRRGEDPTPLYEGALADLTEAIRQSPGDSRIRAARGEAAMQIAVVRLGSGGDPRAMLRDAVADLDAALAKGPKVAAWWRSRGGVRVNLAMAQEAAGESPGGGLDAAIADLTHATTLDPSDANTWAFLGNAHVRRIRGRVQAGEPVEDDARAAIAAYEQAGRLDPAMLVRHAGHLASARALLPAGAPPSGR